MSQQRFGDLKLLPHDDAPLLKRVESISSILSDSCQEGEQVADQDAMWHQCREHHEPNGVRGAPPTYGRVSSRPFEGFEEMAVTGLEERFIDFPDARRRSLPSDMAARCLPNKLDRVSDGKTSRGSVSTAVSTLSRLSNGSADTSSSGSQIGSLLISSDCLVPVTSEHAERRRSQLPMVPRFNIAEPTWQQPQQQEEQRHHAWRGSLTPAVPQRRILQQSPTDMGLPMLHLVPSE